MKQLYAFLRPFTKSQQKTLNSFLYQKKNSSNSLPLIESKYDFKNPFEIRINHRLIAFFILVIIGITTKTSTAQTTSIHDFNTTGQLTGVFNASGPNVNNVSESVNGGIGNTGCISVGSVTTNAIFATKDGYSLGPVESIYKFESFVKSVYNSGYSGLGFAPESPATGSYSAAYRPNDALGISVHGGGFIFHNGSNNYYGSWSGTSSGPITAVKSSSIPDLLNSGSSDDWYRVVFAIERTSDTEYDMRVEIWSANSDGSLINPNEADAIFEVNGATNANITSAPSIYSYFSFSGQRVSHFDNYSINLEGGATVISEGAPVVLTTGASLSGNQITVNGQVTSENGSAVTDRGFVYDTTTEPTIASNVVSSGSGSGMFSANTPSLASGTYYMRAFATNGIGTSYGAQEEVTIATLCTMTASTTSQINVSCNGGNNGEVAAVASGGTAPYSYTWSTGAQTASIEDVVAGTYTVAITDQNACTDSATVVITEPTTLVASAEADTMVSCNGLSDGGASASISGGTAPYSYTWSTGAVTASIEGVVAGTYTVAITDQNACTDSATVVITEPTTLVASAEADTMVSCNGLSDGGASASISGGTAPYRYTWSTGAETASIEGVVAGTYTVAITDQNACTDSATVVITEPSTLVASAEADTMVSCNGLSDGGASASISGGTAPYSYTWSTGAETASIEGVVAGTYTVTITDQNACTDSATVVITEPTTLVASAEADTMVSCNGLSDGGASASISGGTAPYSYTWSTGAETASIEGVVAGTYTVAITDQNGCTDSATVVITEPTTLVASAEADTMVSCNGLSDGGASASISGGTAPYSYTWSTGAETASIEDVVAGTYTVAITDQNGCTDSATVVITEPTTLVASAEGDTMVSCNGLSDGGASASISGGTAPYSYTWSTGAETASIEGVVAGTYTVAITDQNGCTDEETVVITEPEAIISTITQENDLLIADQLDAAYQWLNCDNGMAPIVGANQRSFIPNLSGAYAVRISMGECFELSECITVGILGIEDADEIASKINLYPNPTNGMLHIDLSKTTLNQGLISVFDMSGKLVKNVSINRDLLQLDLSNLSNGIYVVDIEGTRKKVIITN